MRSNAQINSLNKMTLILRHGQRRPSKAKNVALTLLSCWVYSESTAQSQTCARTSSDSNGLQRMGSRACGGFLCSPRVGPSLLDISVKTWNEVER